jgi:predicted transcriptional regulator
MNDRELFKVPLTTTLDKIFLTRFSTKTYQQLSTVAEKKQLSRAQLVRLAVSEYLKESEKQQSQISEPSNC